MSIDVGRVADPVARSGSSPRRRCPGAAGPRSATTRPAGPRPTGSRCSGWPRSAAERRRRADAQPGRHGVVPRRLRKPEPPPTATWSPPANCSAPPNLPGRSSSSRARRCVPSRPLPDVSCATAPAAVVERPVRDQPGRPGWWARAWRRRAGRRAAARTRRERGARRSREPRGAHCAVIFPPAASARQAASGGRRAPRRRRRIARPGYGSASSAWSSMPSSSAPRAQRHAHADAHVGRRRRRASRRAPT